MADSVIIIGGGIGGLFAGAFLSKNGLKVTVFEKNATIGGGLQNFKRGATSFETGIHIVGGFRCGGSLHKICSYLDIMPKLKLRPTDPKHSNSLHFMLENEHYQIPEGRENYCEYFTKLFPHQAANIKNYLAALYALSEEESFYYLRESEHFGEYCDEFYLPYGEFIAKYISDPKLCNILSYMSVLYGGIPDKTPAFVHALINVLYINGEDRFEGGSYQLALALKEVIEKGGGEIKTNCEITKIETANHLITSVEDNKGEKHTANWYISAIHPCAMLKICDEKSFTKAFHNRLEMIPNSYSAFCLHIKFKSGTFPFLNHSSYLLTSHEAMLSPEIVDENWPKSLFYLTCEDENNDRFASSMSVVSPMSFDAVRQWENSTTGDRPESYKLWKQDQAAKILSLLDQNYDGFKDKVLSVWTSSPLTIRDFYGTKEGAMYGYSKDGNNIELSRLSVTTKLSNLLLTGQNINLHGLYGVPLTSIMTAEVIVGKNKILNDINSKYNILFDKN